MLRIVLLVVGCCVLSNAVSVPFITPCKHDDKACLKSSSQKAIPHLIFGVPEWNIPSVEPMHIDSIRNDGNDLTLGFRNMNIYGASKCKIVSVERDIVKSSIYMEADCPIKATGQYDMKGKLLFIEVFGDGNFEIETKNVRIKVDSKISYVDGSDGKKHWKITGFTYSYDLLEKVDFKLDNLFGGDEDRAKPILEVINHSWKEMVTEVGDPIIKELINKVSKIVNKFYHIVPADQLEIV